MYVLDVCAGTCAKVIANKMKFNLFVNTCILYYMYAYMYKLEETYSCYHVHVIIFMLSFLLGAHATRGIIPRLPYGQNNLGISEPTTIALICTLMEVCVDSPDNAR